MRDEASDQVKFCADGSQPRTMAASVKLSACKSFRQLMERRPLTWIRPLSFEF